MAKKKEVNEVDKLFHERLYLALGKDLIAGVDEVGRGPLAGPVVCASVIMPLGDDDIIEGVDDSKKLSEKKRNALIDKFKDINGLISATLEELQTVEGIGDKQADLIIEVLTKEGLK